MDRKIRERNLYHGDYITYRELQDYVKLVPEEYLNTLTIVTESYDHHGCPVTELVISYRSPETDDEIMDRTKREEVRLREEEAIERAELTRLLGKYGNG